MPGTDSGNTTFLNVVKALAPRSRAASSRDLSSFAANALEGYENKEIAMVEIAPEKVQIVNPQDAKLTGTVKSCMFLGTHYQITVSCEENDWIAHSEEFMEDGEEVGILVDAQDLILTDKKE